MRSILLSLIAALTLIGCSASQKTFNENPEVNALIERIDQKFNDSLFQHAFWGVKIMSLDDGEVLYEHNADKMFMPASNQKILTTAAALKFLGPDFRFTTKFAYTGQIADSVLSGSIVVSGNGDPTFYTRFYDDPREVFFIFAEKLKEMGVKKIAGNIIGDDNAFDDDPIGYGWPLNGLDAWYSAEVGALQINEDYIDLKIIPPADVNGETAVIPNLPTDYITIVNEIKVVNDNPEGVRVSRPYGANTIYLTGSVKAGARAFEESPAITNPTKFYSEVLKETLQEKGIVITGEAKDIDDLEYPEQYTSGGSLVFAHESPPLKDILKGLMKRSQNLYAETMPRVMAWAKIGKGSFREGREIVRDELMEFGVDPGSYQYMDGSGLTRYNYVSPEILTKILTGMYKSDMKDDWLELFPIAGVDGTLRGRMKDSPAEGNVRAKTGTISNVRGLSGYVTTADGENIVFSFLVNGHLLSSRDTEDITDPVLEMIAGFSR